MKMQKQNCNDTLAAERKMATKEIFIRRLTEEDRNAVDNLDDLSGNYVAQWLEGNTDYAWGLFADSKLIGYCSIGEAEDVSAVIENYPGYTCDSLILSDVFVLPEYRKQGLGLYMVEQVINERNKENNLIFLKPICDSLGYFYDKLGFRYIDGNEEMVWGHNAICSEATDLPILTKIKELIDQLIGENEPSDADLDYNDAAIEVYADLHNLKAAMENMGL